MIKDSGQRKTYDSGMQRDDTEGKTKYHLCLDGPLFERWAKHLTEGAAKRGDRNWMKGNSQEEIDRAKESAFRHFIQWYNGETDEAHDAAVVFNINAAELYKEKLRDLSPRPGEYIQMPTGAAYWCDTCNAYYPYPHDANHA